MAQTAAPSPEELAARQQRMRGFLGMLLKDKYSDAEIDEVLSRLAAKFTQG